jgi:putative sigma-54 modulation protein
MQIIVTTKNVELSDWLRSYVERKVGKLDRYLPTIDEARVELSVHKTRSIGDSQVVQLTLRANGAILRSEERSADMQASIDAVMDKITRQIERYKGKTYRSQSRVASAQAEALAEEEEAAEVEAEAVVVRTKRFRTRPMTTEEAIEQMELLGHDFFAFFDATDNSFSVVYRRRDGGYGLLQPELA